MKVKFREFADIKQKIKGSLSINCNLADISIEYAYNGNAITFRGSKMTAINIEKAIFAIEGE